MFLALSVQPHLGCYQWRSVVDLTTHAISGLCLDDVIMLSLRRYNIFRVPTQFWI